jgi:hypothetical protein
MPKKISQFNLGLILALYVASNYCGIYMWYTEKLSAPLDTERTKWPIRELNDIYQLHEKISRRKFSENWKNVKL